MLKAIAENFSEIRRFLILMDDGIAFQLSRYDNLKLHSNILFSKSNQIRSGKHDGIVEMDFIALILN